ncbi:MAG: transcription-repair coupling factor [Magnetovibrionaceae bacterium]
MFDLSNLLSEARPHDLGGVPEGLDALLLAEPFAADRLSRDILVIARDERRLVQLTEALAFFAPDAPVVGFPAWDCLPYDRASPNGDVVGRRVLALTKLIEPDRKPVICITTASAFAQFVPPRDAFEGVAQTLKPGQRIAPDALVRGLEKIGYSRADTVMEPGEYATRGGIIDVFPPSAAEPVRLDFFGDELDSLRAFDAASQRTLRQLKKALITPVSEVPLDEDAISRFRSGYREAFGAGDDDPLYEAVSEARRHIGMEHWLPLFHDHLDRLIDYLPEAAIVLDHQAEDSRDLRFEQIKDYFEARKATMGGGKGAETLAGGMPYKALEPGRLFMDQAGWEGALDGRPVIRFSPFALPDSASAQDAGGRAGRDFGDIRVQPGSNVFDAVANHLAGLRQAGRRMIVTAFTRGSRDRLAKLLGDHQVTGLRTVDSWEEALGAEPGDVALCAVGLERGFTYGGLSLLTEQDILGERMSRTARKRVKAENIISEAASLAPGDLVVHVDHGIGRFDGLVTLEVGGAPHDCVKLTYDGDDRLFLPVENIELLSRYGSDSGAATLDKLGGAAWQARKAKMKQRIRDMADELIGIAAARALKSSPPLEAPTGLYDEFCARFPFSETEDQLRAIEQTLEGLGSGKVMDRLVCGDVGFGKTEVALRAAFVTAMAGRQVAIVVPTTLLARQHFKTFEARFKDLPIRIEQLSRLVTTSTAKAAKEGLKDGQVDIVIGTHALLAKDVQFRDLGLLIIDEEQHFGVKHKEKLKRLKGDVHVLTLSATPIPRTLQLALTGVRELSLIATPPVDRLAVRTFVLPFDAVVIREAILRERYRGGQTFYVCPRIEDLAGLYDQLAELVPEVKVVAVHGQMPVKDLEAAVGAFYDGEYDVLLSTNIIESGIDLPRVNTIILHRADMFGLAQLYQLRGRVGRGKTRAYAYLTLPPQKKLTPAAQKRLEVMQTLDSLGAGFTLASHDMDIRGAGNLLGEEQSGHIREVGIELYQQMLEEAVAEARGMEEAGDEAGWSPQISLGMPVLIPEAYVGDLNLRMNLYRRLADLGGPEEVDGLAAEMVDRFGPLPPEAENLMQTVSLKLVCKAHNIEKIDAGPKGATLSFRNDTVDNPEGVVRFIAAQAGTAKLRPDQKLVFIRDWPTPDARLAGVRRLLNDFKQALKVS